MTTTEKMLCPECNSELKLKNGKYGEFYGCSSYPNCRYIQNKDAVKGAVSKENKPLSPVYSAVQKPYSKPTYNPTSQYVSYAKDVFLELREMIHVEVMKPGSKMEIVADEQIMARAISLVKQAIKEFE